MLSPSGIRMRGIFICLSYSGKPDGLSFCKISSAVVVALTLKISSVLKGTKFSVIHSPFASAWLEVISFPIGSSKRIGKLASKYHVPLALPMIIIGDNVFWFGRGASTIISVSATGWLSPHGVDGMGARGWPCFIHWLLWQIQVSSSPLIKTKTINTKANAIMATAIFSKVKFLI